MDPSKGHIRNELNPKMGFSKKWCCFERCAFVIQLLNQMIHRLTVFARALHSFRYCSNSAFDFWAQIWTLGLSGHSKTGSGIFHEFPKICGFFVSFPSMVIRSFLTFPSKFPQIPQVEFLRFFSGWIRR